MSTDLGTRFWRRVRQSNGPDACWIWTGALHRQGYGSIKVDKATALAHRVSWLLCHGEMPAQCVCHRCDNPPCVNPSHLFLGSYADNMRDMTLKGRHGGTKLSDADVRALRAIYGTKSIYEVAEQFDISIAQTYRIAVGERRKYVS